MDQALVIFDNSLGSHLLPNRPHRTPPTTMSLRLVLSACPAALVVGFGLLLFDGLARGPTERARQSWEPTVSTESRHLSLFAIPFHYGGHSLAKASPSTQPSTGPPFVFEGHVYGKSDVEGRKNRPVEVLALAVKQPKIAQLSEAASGGDRSKHNLPSGQDGEIRGIVGTVPEPFSRFAAGHDVTSAGGRYQISVGVPGLYYLCLTGETSVPKSTPWTIAGCMGAQMPPPGPKSGPQASGSERPRFTKEQDLYMQFGRLVEGE